MENKTPDNFNYGNMAANFRMRYKKMVEERNKEKVKKNKTENPLEKITRIFFSNRRKMIKKPFNQIFNGDLRILNKLKLDLNLRPQNLSPETYFKLTQEYENLIS